MYLIFCDVYTGTSDRVQCVFCDGILRNWSRGDVTSIQHKNFKRYKCYSIDNRVSAKAMCEAGFFYEGDGDKCKSFWCDGALEMWSQGDEPWGEHTK